MKKMLLVFIAVLVLLNSTFANGLINVFNYKGKKAIYIKDQTIEVEITNNYARTNIKQIFASNYQYQLEGEYIFPIDEGVEISDFAVWDNGKKIKGVILEKKRARSLYENLVRRLIDPGLLEHKRPNEFSARLAPIPAYGTKRMELEYTQILELDSNQFRYKFNLVSDQSKSKIKNIKIIVKFHTDQPVVKIEPFFKDISVEKLDESTYNITYSARDLDPMQDFGFDVTFAPRELGISIITHKPKDSPTGYFLLSMIPQETITENKSSPKKFLFIVDRSVSVKDYKKLIMEAAGKMLDSLKPEDKFNFVFFNNYPETYSASYLENNYNNRSEILNHIENLEFYGGTNILKTFEQAFSVINTRKEQGIIDEIVFISDGNTSYYEISMKKILTQIKELNTGNLKMFCFGTGNYSNRTLMEDLSDSTNGAYLQVRNFENYENPLKHFTEKFYLGYIKNLEFDWSGLSVSEILPVDSRPVYLKQQIYLVGKYSQAGNAEIKISGNINDNKVEYKEQMELPAENELNSFLPRIWARERVNYLLKQISIHGEKEEWVDEIIELSKKFKFVTPYTSFLAAPRSYLKPRTIRPADPYIFIKTDENISKVIVKFPFGETREAVFDRELKLWKVRFIVPKDTPDGEYLCTVITFDKFGNQFQEELSYIVDSNPPVLKVWMEPDRAVSPGEMVTFFARASKDTEYLYVLTPDSEKVLMRYDPETGYSIGKWKVPALNHGKFDLKVIAVDFAKNKTSETLKLKIN